jgi:hypothetical protein
MDLGKRIIGETEKVGSYIIRNPINEQLCDVIEADIWDNTHNEIYFQVWVQTKDRMFILKIENTWI